MKIINVSKHSTQWLTYSYLIAGLTLNNQPAQATLRWVKAVKYPCEIRGTVNLRAIYQADSTFEAALSGSSQTLQNQEDFVRMILLNRFRIVATVLDRQQGGSKPVGKVTLLASNISQYELSYRITDLPQNEPIVLRVEVPQELAGDAYLEGNRKVFQAVGWTGIALLTPESPKLDQADFTLRVLTGQ